MSIFSENNNNYEKIMFDFAGAALRKARVRGEFEILSYDNRRIMVSAGQDPNKREFAIRMWTYNNYNIIYSVFEYIDGSKSGTSLVSDAEYILPPFQELEYEAERIWSRIYDLAHLIDNNEILMNHFEKYFPDYMDEADTPGAALCYLGQYRYLKEGMGKPLI
jgi:hypothetical protein